MSLSRTHIAFLGIISMLTGFIGPGTSTLARPISYLMTDLHILSYIVLFFLISAFYMAAIRSWRWYRIATVIIILSVAYLLGATLFGSLHDTKDGLIASGLLWGWLFLSVGAILMIVAYRQPVGSSLENFSETVDNIIGIIGGFGLACIVGIIILSSFSFFGRSHKTQILIEKFGSGNVTSLTGGIYTYGSYESIESLEYERSTDILDLIARKGSDRSYIHSGDTQSKVILPQGEAPHMIGGTLYMVDRVGHIYSGGLLLTGAVIIGGEKSIYLPGENGGQIIHENGSWGLSYTGEIAAPILSESLDTLAGKGRIEGKEVLILQGRQIGDIYEKILNMTLSPSGKSVMAVVESSGSKLIIKNGEKVGTLGEGYITGSYRSNGSHSIALWRKTDSNISSTMEMW